MCPWPVHHYCPSYCEAPGTGAMGIIARGIAAVIPNSTVAAVPYPAQLDNYPVSEGTGVAAMTDMIEKYSAACAGGKMSLLGYSQASIDWQLRGCARSIDMLTAMFAGCPGHK